MTVERAHLKAGNVDLQNEKLLAKNGCDTDENEPLQRFDVLTPMFSYFLMMTSNFFQSAITRAAPLPRRLYPAALAFYRNFKVWGERVLGTGAPHFSPPPR